MAINVGDIYFVGYFGQGTGDTNAGNPSGEGFAIVVKNAIAAGEVLSFTDGALQSSGAFATNEQTINFTVPAGGLAAGTVVQFPLNGTNTTTVYANAGGGNRTAIGTIKPTGNTGLSNSGDQVFAFQGTLASPTVLAGVDAANNSPIASGSTSTNTTYAPTNGAPFLDLPQGSNNAQIAIDPTTATAAQLVDPANYTQNIPTTTNPEASFSGITCFTTGTRIRTVRGNVAVEALVVGDRAVTATGMTRPIIWIGQRHLDCTGRVDTAPVRIVAGAFGAGLPARDLQLSPGHPVLVGADADGEGGHLVPIMCLVNGTTVRRETVEAVTYWHVELDAHDILLAEGLPAESYLDWGDRDFFVEGADHALANPDFVVPGLEARCRPVAIDGAVVEQERLRLDALLAARLAKSAAWPEGVSIAG